MKHFLNDIDNFLMNFMNHITSSSHSTVNSSYIHLVSILHCSGSFYGVLLWNKASQRCS